VVFGALFREMGHRIRRATRMSHTVYCLQAECGTAKQVRFGVNVEVFHGHILGTWFQNVAE